MYQLYTDELRRVLSVAQKHAVQRQLEGVGVTPSEAGALYESLAVQPVAGSVEEPLSLPYTPGAGRVLHLTLGEMRQLRSNYIGTEHLLLALIRHLDDPWAEPEPASEYVEQLGVDLRRLREELLSRIPADPDPAARKQREIIRGLPPIAQMDWWPGK